MADTDELMALKTDPKLIFFTDFDGTITLQDSNDYMTDTIGFGSAQRKELNRQVLDGTLPFRNAFHQMMLSISTPFDECIQYLVKNVQLDPGFKSFLDYATANNIPVVVLSGGMTPIIQALLEHLVGEAANTIQIISNHVGARPGKSINETDGWEITFHDESGFGHDKSRAIRPYANLPADKRPTLFYAGDGVSDLSAARETDLLFAKSGRDLVDYCVREDVPFTVFNDWNDITSVVKDIVNGKITVSDAAAEGYRSFKTSLLNKRLDGGARSSGHTTPIVPEAGGGSKPRT